VRERKGHCFKYLALEAVEASPHQTAKTSGGKDISTGKEITFKNDMPLEIASHDILLIPIPVPK
jgi:hypothetical protein